MKSITKPLQPLQIDTREFSLEEGLRIGRDLVGEGNVMLPLPSNPPKFSFRAKLWVFTELAGGTHSEMNFRLRRQSGQNPADAIRYHLVCEGRVDGIIDGEAVTLRAGDIIAMSTSVPFAVDFEDYAGSLISLSTASLGHKLTAGFGYRVLPADEPETRMIYASAEGFFDAVAEADPEAGKRTASMLRGVLEKHFESMQRSDDTKSDRGRDWQKQMLQFIEENLHDPSLGVETLTSEFPASRSVVYRSLEKFGGVAKYITRRRLERALGTMLFDRPDTPIGDIAESLGFSSRSQFSTVFRKHYGVAPSEARTAFAIDETHIATEEASSSKRGLLMREMHERSGHM